MNLILIGLIFVLFDFQVELPNVTLGLLPDFVGYGLLSAGVGGLAGKSRTYARLKPLLTAMAGYTCVLYVLSLLRLSLPFGALFLLLNLALLPCFLYELIKGLGEVRASLGAAKESPALRNAWVFHLVSVLLTAAALFVEALLVPAFLVSVSAGLVLFYEFYRTGAEGGPCEKKG